MHDSVTISDEARRMEAEQGYLDLGRIAYAKQAQEDTEEIPTCPHEERVSVQLAMNAAPVCPRWFWWFFVTIVALIGAVVCGVACLLGWAVS